jgi:FeS assembly SUF system protein
MTERASEERRESPPYTPWQPEGASPPPEAPQAEAAASSAPPPASGKVREEDVIAAISTVYDPEIPVNIYELGLIYAIDISEEGDVKVEMTLTAPACPSAQELPGEVEAVVSAVPGVRSVTVEVVWDPPWDPSRMSDEARLELGMF